MAAAIDTAGGTRAPQEGLKREVGLLGLMWSSEGSIIGSGWLFGALLVTTIAGPAGVISWVIASFIIILLALVHAELGGMFAVTGGTTRFPHYAFGTVAGANFGWFSFLQAAAVAPIEVLATIQYASGWWTAARGWFVPSSDSLSGSGILVALALLAIFTLVNFFGIRWLAGLNTGLTTWKVAVPIVAILVLLLTHFHGSNFSAEGGFFLKGADIPKTLMIAIPSGGVVFSLLGFEQAVQLAGEARNPSRDVPRAVIGAIIIGAIIYVLVQFAFIGALSPSLLAHYTSWTQLGSGAVGAALKASPYYTLATAAGITWLAVILAADSWISPAGTGLVYLTSTSRIAFGMSRNGYVPEVFEKTTSRTKVPGWSLILSFLIGILFILPFPSWSSLVGIVTSASVLMYAGAPLSLGALRKSKPDLPRPYRLAGATVLAPLAFVLASFIVYWAGWQTYSTLIVAILLGYILMLLSVAFKLNSKVPKFDWSAAKWIFPYLIGMGILSYNGGFGPGGIIGGVGPFANVLVGGSGRLPLWYDLVAVAIFALVIYYIAMATRLPSEKVDEYIAQTQGVDHEAAAALGYSAGGFEAV